MERKEIAKELEDLIKDISDANNYSDDKLSFKVNDATLTIITDPVYAYQGMAYLLKVYKEKYKL